MTKQLDPHPYALLLPSLTQEEYAALKADIAKHGILYPVICDEANRVLDGVHRVRIAGELSIEPPVSRHEGLSDERKMHLAVGLNMRRRHLDADRRRELVRRLHDEGGLSRRKISSITGWSKSTVDRDLKTSPFEEALAAARDGAAGLRKLEPKEISEALAGTSDATAELLGFADAQWKRGNWPPPPAEHLELTLGFKGIRDVLDALIRLLQAESQEERERIHQENEKHFEQHEEHWRAWGRLSLDEREARAREAQEKGILWGPVDA